MIISTCFDGDNDDTLKMLQHGCYYNMLREWITKAGTRRLRYRTDPAWAEVTQLWERFREDGYYDHRTIQMHHDLIAAQFRQQAKGTALSGDNLDDAWHAFFRTESAAWLEQDEFLRCFMLALSAKDSTNGYDAEDTMIALMMRKYTELTFVKNALEQHLEHVV